MTLKKLHFITGLTITGFVGLHLFNHLVSINGADKHMEVMNALRPIYRNIIIETLLILAVIIQIFSGIRLFSINRKRATTFFDKLQLWSGLYLALFLVIHLSAVFVGRLVLHLDTNFYFGVAGLNSFPANLFFIPYYALTILSFFGHIAAIHCKKMKQPILGLTPIAQSKLIIAFGIVLTIIVFYGLTNHFNGVVIPKEYEILTGK